MPVAGEDETGGESADAAAEDEDPSHVSFDRSAAALIPRALLACSAVRRPAPLAALALPWRAAAPTTGNDRPGTEATLLLDFAPNAVHAGIYLATEREYDEAEGVELDVRAPGASTDALKLLEAGPRRHGDPRHPRPRARARAGRTTSSA